VPREILSAQQKQIYELYKHGLSNKQIAVKLNLEQRSIATQLSRIRKKAAKLPLTYKIEPGACSIFGATKLYRRRIEEKNPG
jgi:FixJ family two-component response regulator